MALFLNLYKKEIHTKATAVEIFSNQVLKIAACMYCDILATV